jgi:hypothetical protein
MAVELSRRDFLGRGSAMTCAASLNMVEASVSHPGAGYIGTLCLFSTPLPGIDWRVNATRSFFTRAEGVPSAQ